MDTIKAIDFSKKSIFDKESPNIIFYGKNIKINDYLISLFGNFSDVSHGNIIYQNNQYCKIFDIQMIKSKFSDEFFKLLKCIISSNNYYSKYKQHIIILNNYNHISVPLQTKLRVIIEKYRKTTQFVIVTNSFNVITNPIHSRCLCIRVPCMNHKQKRMLAKKYIQNKSYEERIPIYDCIYSLNDKNKMILYLKYNNYIHSHKDIYFTIYQKINEWFIGNDVKMDNIKQYSYNLLKYDITDIHKKLCEYFISDPKYVARQKFKIIKCLTDCEYEFKKSYRKLVHIEKMFIQLIYLLD